MIMHGLKQRARRGIAAAVLGAGAVVFVAPPVTLAQEAPQKVDKEQVPQKVRQARQEAVPQGSDVDWYRTTRDGRTVFIAQFKGGGEEGKRREMRISEEGKVLEGPVPARDLAAERGAPAPAAAPGALAGDANLVAGGTAEERRQIDALRLQVETDRQEIERMREDYRDLDRILKNRGENLSPQRRESIKNEQRALMARAAEREQQQAQRERDIQTLSTTIATRRKSELERLNATERDRMLAEDRRSLETERERIARIRQEERARLAREQDLSDDRDEKDRGNDGVRYRGITAAEVPDNVKDVMARYTKGMEDLRYRRELRGDNISYSVHYVNPRENKRYWTSISEDGKVNSEPRLSIYQPGTDNDVRLASGKREGADRPAADRPAADRPAADDIRYKDIERADVPRRALQALEKHAANARDLKFRREERPNGKTTYSVHYVQPNNNKRYFASVNEDGSTVTEPRLSEFQTSDRRD